MHVFTKENMYRWVSKAQRMSTDTTTLNLTQPNWQNKIKINAVLTSVYIIDRLIEKSSSKSWIFEQWLQIEMRWKRNSFTWNLLIVYYCL